MQAVDAGEVDVIAARHVDRLLRRLSELEDVLKRCEPHKVAVVTASDGVDTSTDGGRLVVRILASVGQGEMERKSARQRSAAVQAAQQGRWIGGRRAFGYEGDGVTIRDNEASLIRRGYREILNGASMAEVARAWNAAGASTPQGRRDGTSKPWDHANARDVLTNPRYAGLRRYRTTADRAAIRQDPTLGITGKAVWPAVISEDVWRASVEILCDPGRWHPVKGGRKLLTGLAVCGVCGLTVHGGAGSHGNRSYRCRSGAHVVRKSDPVDEYVETVAVARLTAPDALEYFAPRVHRDISPLIDELNAARQRLDSVAVEFAEEILTASQLCTVTEVLKRRIAEFETRISEAGRRDIIAPLVQSDNIMSQWSSLKVSARRAVLETLMTVRLHPVGRGRRAFDPATVEIAWRTE
jgi:site-specific DNA recombinase